MTFLKFAALVCASFALISGAQNREASKEVRSKLFKQVMTDVADLRECIQTDEGGATAAEEKATVEEVDVNRDGFPETSTNGYLDVLVTARNNAATASESTFKFDGKQYRETSAH